MCPTIKGDPLVIKPTPHEKPGKKYKSKKDIPIKGLGKADMSEGPKVTKKLIKRNTKKRNFDGDNRHSESQ